MPAAWQEAGIGGRVERWDDPAVDWSAYDAVVVRSVWAGGVPDVSAGRELRTPAPDQVEPAEKVLAAVPHVLLYARIDLVRLSGGAPAVIEVELTEPYLFLGHEPSAPANFARALRELL